MNSDGRDYYFMLDLETFSDIIEKNIWKERERWNGNRIRNILTISIARNASCPKGKKVELKRIKTIGI